MFGNQFPLAYDDVLILLLLNMPGPFYVISLLFKKIMTIESSNPSVYFWKLKLPCLSSLGCVIIRFPLK